MSPQRHHDITMRIAVIALPLLHASVATAGQDVVVCWGRSSEGQCAPPLQAISAVAVGGGEWASYGITSAGAVLGWGSSWSGETNIPANLMHTIKVDGGAGHAVALDLVGRT